MALTWDWKDKVGTVKVLGRTGKGEMREQEFPLYNGNAFLICLHEFTEDDVDKYDMQWFFVDKAHMNRMLGLVKGTSNCLNTESYKVTGLNLDANNCRNIWDIVKAFVKAFGDITINFYTKKEGD